MLFNRIPYSAFLLISCGVLIFPLFTLQARVTNVRILSFDSNKTILPFTDKRVTVSWEAENVISGSEPNGDKWCQLFNFVDYVTSPVLPEDVRNNGDSIRVLPSGSMDYDFTGFSGRSVDLRLRCQGGTLTSVEQGITILLQEDPAHTPTINFLLDGNDEPITKTLGSTVKIGWRLRGPERCTTIGWTYNGATDLPSSVLYGDHSINIPVTGTATYALECWNGDLSVKKSLLLTVSDPPPLPSPSAPSTPSQNPGTTNPNPGQASVSSGALLNFANPLAFTTIPSLLTTLLTSLQNIIVTLALIFIIIGAFLYLTSAGDESRMASGKKAILAALIGLALGIAAPTFLKEIYSILGASSNSVPAALSLLQIASNILSFLLTIIGIITIIMMVIGGMMYLTAAGNEDQIDKGKKIVKYSLIGITIALAALVLVKQVAKFFVG